MRKLYVKEGNKELCLDFPDDVLIKVDGNVFDSTLLSVNGAGMLASTRFKFEHNGAYMEEGTKNIYIADLNLLAEVIP